MGRKSLYLEKIFKWFCIGVCCVAFSACTSEKAEFDGPGGDGCLQLTFSRAATRADVAQDGSGDFVEGDRIGLYIDNGTDVSYRQLTLTGGQWLPLLKRSEFGSGRLNLSAWYAGGSELSTGQTEGVPFRIASDQSGEGHAASDLLLARTADVPAGTTAPVDLTFRHAMHRLVVTFTDDSDVDTESVQTVCTARSACTVDLLDGTLKTDEDRKASFSARGKSVFFLLVPQKTSDVEFELRFDDRTCRVSLSDHAGSHDELLGGMQLHVELTLKEGRVEIGKTTIEGWGDQGTVEGEIIL